MACCYIAASMIGFLVHSCEALDLKIGIQYNDASKILYAEGADSTLEHGEREKIEKGVSIISIQGMTCAACTGSVERSLRAVPGVHQALVSLDLQEARVLHKEEVGRLDLIAAVEDAGYSANADVRSSPQKAKSLMHVEELEMIRTSLRGLTLFSTVIFAVGTGIDWLALWSGAGAILASTRFLKLRHSFLILLTSFAAGRYGQWCYQSACAADMRGRVNMHSLIAVSTSLSLGLTLAAVFHRDTARLDSTYFDSIIGVLLIVAVGRYLDLVSRRRATETFAGLYSLMDQTSFVELASTDSGGGQRVPTAAVRQGDEIIIKPYSMIPCDSYVVEGQSHVNEAVMTGESVPKPKVKGDLLISGSRNGPGLLTAKVRQTSPDTSFLSQLIISIENALTAKVAVQSHVDAITHYFVIIIFAIAAAGGLHAYFLSTRQGFNEYWYDAVGRKVTTILAAACPCALGLATPCAVMAGIDIAWRCGILMLHGGQTMEQLSRVTHVVMDKTGTLTAGEFGVQRMCVASAWGQRDASQRLVAVICAVEEQALTAHPLSLAIFKHLFPLAGDEWKQFRTFGAVSGFHVTPGQGIQCSVSLADERWHQVMIGSRDFAGQGQADMTEFADMDDVGVDGSQVFVVVDGVFAARISLQDNPRPDAKSTIDTLKERGLHITMLTGDNDFEAHRISSDLQIPTLASHASPQAKLRHIKRLQDQGHRVMMVGDGMNDGPALAAADVGVMISHGSKCLSSGGSVLLLQSQLTSLLTLLDIASSTMTQVTANIIWALSYNILAVALAIGLGSSFGLNLSPAWAAFMMSTSSVFITTQGLLLRTRLSKRHCKNATGLAWDF